MESLTPSSVLPNHILTHIGASAGNDMQPSLYPNDKYFSWIICVAKNEDW